MRKSCERCELVPLAHHIPGRGWVVGCACTAKISFYPTEQAAWLAREQPDFDRKGP